jgi:tetratricopeptide (TPR) repeat protein
MENRLYRLAILVCLLTASALAFQRSRSPDQPAIAEVESALRSQAYGRALQLSRTALAARPRDYRMWTLQGMAYDGAHEPASAADAYRHALGLLPDYLPALEGAAQVEFKRGGKDTESLLRRILLLRPADPTTHAMLAVLQARRGECKDAVDHFAQARSVVDSQFPALSSYGICLAKLGRFDQAIPVFQQALVLAPGEHTIRYNLALALREVRRYDDAIEALTPEIQPTTANEDTLTLAADLYEAKNDTPRAVALLRQAIVANPSDSSAYLSFVTLSSNHASYQVGIDMLNAGLARMPSAAQLHLARGVLYSQLGNYQKGMEDFEAANRLDPQLSFVGTAEGIAETQRHDFSKGLAKFREQVRLHPGNAFDQYLLAEALAQQGPPEGSPEYAEELRAAKEAVRLDPNLALAHDILANLYLRSGKTALAIEQCEAVLGFDPNNQEALYHLILSLRQTNRRGEIPSLTKRLLALRSTDRMETAHKTRYQLTDTVPSSAASSAPLP